MATIKPYVTASGATGFVVRYRQPNRKTTNRHFKLKRDAVEFANTVETQKLSGSYVSPALGRVTVGQLGVEWLARHRSHRSRESAWRVHVLPQWGDVRISDVRATDVQAWITLLSTDSPTGRCKGVGLKAPVIETCLTVLLGVMDDAVTDRRIAVNPLRDRLKYPPHETRPHTYLTHAQVCALAAEAKYPEIVLTLAYTGVRWCELASLRVRHLDMLRRRISLEHVKGHRGRVVSMPLFVAEALAQVCEGKGREDLLWTDVHGKVLESPGTTSWLHGAVERCMRSDPTFPRITAHSLRHTYASLAVSSGANVKVVQRQLGHKSAAMTLDIYSDLFTTDLDSVAQAFDLECAHLVPKAVEITSTPWVK